MVFNFGGEPEVAPTANCSVDHAEVMQGEPVTATVSTTNFNPKHPLTYAWSGNGGTVTGKDTSAAIDTKGVAGGNYNVTAKVTDPEEQEKWRSDLYRKLHGERAAEESADNELLGEPDDTTSRWHGDGHLYLHQPRRSACECCGLDCQQRPGFRQWQHRHGEHDGCGARTSDSQRNLYGFPWLDGELLVAIHDRESATPPPKASKLSQCDFPNEKKPWRVDNTCKAILDDVALRLQQEADAKLVIVGNADPSEKRKNLAAERALNSKAYLSGGEAKQAIDATRIETRTGNGGSKTAEYWVVPAGANFDSAGTEAVDETKVQPVPDHPKPAAKKKAAKKAQ